MNGNADPMDEDYNDDVEVDVEGMDQEMEEIPSIYLPPRQLIPPRTASDIDNIDAGTAQLGPEFDKAKCLMIAEVKVILDREKREVGKAGVERPHNEVLEKTLAYCTRFSAFTNPHTIRNLKRSIDPSKWYPFEVALLGNLTIESVEEARALIQSLDRSTMDDNEILNTLNELQNLRKYTAPA
ncbi:HRDC-like protein [Geranomyces variabilis]|nr:HRDC-like protein [Geranomyces variabilis]KAJ3133437.1 RNA polymerase B [Geranomyces variabilis]